MNLMKTNENLTININGIQKPLTRKQARRFEQVAAYADNHCLSTDEALRYQRKVSKWCHNTPEQHALGGLGRDWAWH
jgi:hypothetical protein